jgi:hypothetical protein
MPKNRVFAPLLMPDMEGGGPPRGSAGAPDPPAAVVDPTAVPGGERPAEPPKFLLAASGLAAAATLAAAAGLAVWAAFANGELQGRISAHAFAAGCVGVALVILHGLDRGTSGLGLFRPLVGADGRFSTSLTQLGIWTVAAGSGFAYLLGRAMFEGVALNDVLPGATWDEYLILLGGPFAAAVLAKGITTYKLDAGTLQKSEASAPAPGQIATNDEGAVDLVDSQYLLFNVIALGYFAVEIVTRGVLPAMPGPLLAMTSATAALYVANKAAHRNAPQITSVSPATAGPLQTVVVLGVNFDPSDSRDGGRRVTLALTGCPETVYSTRTSDTEVVFVVPAAAAAGDQTVSVTSTAGAQTPPYPLQIRSGAIVVKGVDGDKPLRPGASATILLGRALPPSDEALIVSVGGALVAATPGPSRDRVAFTVPSDVSEEPDGTAVVSLELGTAHGSRALPVERPQIRSAWRLTDGGLAVAATGWHGDPVRVPPAVLLDGRPLPLRVGWREEPDRPLVAELPDGHDSARPATLSVVDDLGRRSADHALPPDR